MTPKVTRKAEGRSRKDARSEEIALALMGFGPFPTDVFAADVTWERGDGAPLSGPAAIQAALSKQEHPDCITVDQVITHGKAASVSGHLMRGSDARIFCHVIRHTSEAATQIAQVVSFEHGHKTSGSRDGA